MMLMLEVLDKDQIKKDYPIINTDEILGGILYARGWCS